MFHAKKNLTQTFLTHIFFDPIFFWPTFFFGPHFFWPTFFFGQHFFRPKFFFGQKKFRPNFSSIWDLESGNFGIQNLGFRIWGLGSVTWNPVFGIQDLGLRIWDLDSSWPTDPFDQLGVAQLSQILLLINNIYFMSFYFTL